MSDDGKRFLFDAFSAVLLLATALIGAYLPRYLNSKSGSGGISAAHSLAFHLGNMLSAGVMLSAGFCHLLADAQRNQHLLVYGKRFPMSNFLAAVGYIVTLLADQVVQQITDSQAKPEHAAAVAHDYKKLAGAMELASVSSDAEKAFGGDEGLPVSTLPINGHIHRHHAHGQGADADGSKLPLLLPGANGSDAQLEARCHAPGALQDQHQQQHSDQQQHQQQEDCHAGVAMFLGKRKLSFATAVLLAAALCIHSILEGMALGAQTSMRSTEDIMIAIAAHKGLAAYALGASVVESGASAGRFWTVIALFAVATPVGIFIGYGISGNANSLGGAALSALASGTFLYVAFMEVIPKELADGKHRVFKMLMFLTGFGLMSLLAIWA